MTADVHLDEAKKIIYSKIKLPNSYLVQIIEHLIEKLPYYSKALNESR